MDRTPDFRKTRLNFLSSPRSGVDRFHRPLLLTGLVMYALSWRVWTYQELYPAIPFFSRIPYLGPLPSWLLFAALLAAFTLCLSGVRSRTACAVYVAASVALMLQDQHRLQPWAYQFALYAAILCWAQESERAPLVLALTAGIYFYSGLQKLNYSFIAGTGTALLGVMLKPFGVTPEALPFPALAAMTLGMGFSELALAPALLYAPTRKYGAWTAITMHTAILFCLGPWNLDWNYVVWPWNLMMIAFNALFASAPAEMGLRVPTPAADDSRLRRAGRAVLLAVLTLPVLRFADLFDSYPAFGMYIDYYHQSDLYVLWDAAGRLPKPVRKHLEKPAIDGLGRLWSRLNAIEWSVAQLEVPPYLENRDTTGVAIALCHRFRLGDFAAAELGGLPNLRTGVKTKLRAYVGCAHIRSEANRYLLNARPVENLYRNAEAKAPAFALWVPRPAPCERSSSEALRFLAVGKIEDAAKSFTVSVEEARQAGTEPRDCVRCLDAAAGFYASQRLFAQADSLYVESLATYAAALPDDEGRRDAVYSLVVVYVHEGKLKDAERMLRDWREDSKRRAGEETPNEAYALQSLALLAGEQGRGTQARDLYRRSIDLYKKLLSYHPGASDGLAGLAAIAAREKKDAEAEALYEKSIEIKTKLLGPSHAYLADGLSNYAAFLRSRHRHTQAAALEMRATAMRSAR